MRGMSVATRASRTPVWAEGLGEWSWPGRGRVVADLLPPAWVPTFPPRLEPAAVAAGSVGGSGQVAWRTPAAVGRWSLRALAGGLAAVCATLMLVGSPLGVLRTQAPGHNGGAASRTSAATGALPTPPLPTLVAVSHDAAGSAIDRADYSSEALHAQGSFLTYLPPGYAGATRRYPVIYLLHGNDQTSDSFLEIGLQGALDRLIARHLIPPLIAVMIQGGPGANNWRDLGARRYESYVLEVQQLVDRALPTQATRGGRAIAGYSMGGYGAMNMALAHPERFAAVESWLGFFDGLHHELRADRRLLPKLGLRAFLYGAASDTIADPAENAPFAAALRSAGVSARSAVYPGDHTLTTLHAHLQSMLAFAGGSFSL
jgi:enterochelin esterase-like enzyme